MAERAKLCIEMAPDRQLAIAVEQCSFAVGDLVGADVKPRPGSDNGRCTAGGIISIVDDDIRIERDLVTIDTAGAEVFNRRAL